MSVLGACWAQAQFGRKAHVGEIQLGGKEHVEGRCTCRKRNTCKEDVHAGKAARARQTCMQKRKACEAHMQEDLAMIGLGFW
jgi:hypothetical protein